MKVNPFWLVGSLGLDLRNEKMAAWKKVFDGGLFVEPHMPELNEFKTYFISKLQVRANGPSKIIIIRVLSARTAYKFRFQ